MQAGLGGAVVARLGDPASCVRQAAADTFATMPDAVQTQVAGTLITVLTDSLVLCSDHVLDGRTTDTAESASPDAIKVVEKLQRAQRRQTAAKRATMVTALRKMCVQAQWAHVGQVARTAPDTYIATLVLVPCVTVGAIRSIR